MFWINVYQRKMKEGTFKALDPTSLLNFLDEPTLSEIFPSSTGNFRFEMLSSKTGSLSLVSFSHDCRRPPITEVQKTLRFYDDNYEIVSQHHLTPGKKIFLGNRNDKKCRFCGGAEPEKSFKKAAHVIPESLGNKTLFSYYECDQCNTLFGDGIENDFGSWSKPMRTLARINGKRGSPTIKHKDGKWRVKVTSPQNIRVSSYEHNPDIMFDEENMEVTFNFRRDRYTPVAVLKSLVKMGLSILSSDEVMMFQDALL